VPPADEIAVDVGELAHVREDIPNRAIEIDESCRLEELDSAPSVEAVRLLGAHVTSFLLALPEPTRKMDLSSASEASQSGGFYRAASAAERSRRHLAAAQR
jgi:hypothetical protein